MKYDYDIEFENLDEHHIFRFIWDVLEFNEKDIHFVEPVSLYKTLWHYSRLTKTRSVLIHINSLSDEQDLCTRLFDVKNKLYPDEQGSSYYLNPDSMKRINEFPNIYQGLKIILIGNDYQELYDYREIWKQTINNPMVCFEFRKS